MKSDILILGGTGSIGYAFTQNLLAKNRPVTLLVRNVAKAQGIFEPNPLLEIIEGDAQNGALLKELAQDKKVIFHGINYPYHEWKVNMMSVTQHIIEAASVNNAQIIFPGNVYNYGNMATPIVENSPEKPCSIKGQLRVELETTLREAARQGKCNVLIVRLPDFWGENVQNEGVKPIFMNALKGKAMPWLIRIDIPHQAVYTPDAAEIMVRLMLATANSTFELYNYGGQIHDNIQTLFEQIAKQAHVKPKFMVYPKWMVAILAWFMPVLKEIQEMYYLYENTVVLNDDKLRNLFPDFHETSLEEAIQNTLRWFKQYSK